MKIALVYDRVNKIGGAERILESLHEIYPRAPLFTLVYDDVGAPWAKSWQVKTSFLQHIPLARHYHEFFPVIPIFAFEQFDFSTYDIVISVTATEAKGIITGPATLHISYILTPTRYLWSHYKKYFTHKWLRRLSFPAISYLRLWDQIASQRPDVLVSISETVRQRIKKYYHRESQVIYPPVEIQKSTHSTSSGQAIKIQSFNSFGLTQDKFAQDRSDISKFKIKAEDYFLIVSRLVRYKRIDLAIEACNMLKLPLKIVGTGMEEGRLRKIAGSTVEFLGNLTDKELSGYYQNCRALLFPQEEDFGIVAVEALSFGKPVIAYKGGGVTEFIIEGKSGEFFHPDTPQALIDALEKSMNKTYSQDFCRKTYLKFSKSRFKREFGDFVKKKWEEFKIHQS